MQRQRRPPLFALGRKPSWRRSTRETPRRSRRLWTEDGEYIDDTGRHFVGRDAIEKGYAEFFAANPNAKIQITIDSLRLLSSDTAIEDGRAVADCAIREHSGFTKYTVIHVKVDGKW